MDSRKRARPEAEFNGNGGLKKRQETDSGIGGKTKPCTKFFSMAGCPFGEGCHFLHYVPGGYNSAAHSTKVGPGVPQLSRNLIAQHPNKNGVSPSALKSRLCNKFNTAEGCKFGDKCNFAHGEWEISKPFAPSHDDPRAKGQTSSHLGMGLTMMGVGAPTVPPPQARPTATFAASATAKVSVDASLAGIIIGKGGVNSKQIVRQTGAKLSIKDHESDLKLKNIELEGSFEQIQQASAMVRELITNVGSSMTAVLAKPHRASTHVTKNLKTKLCENYAKGSCTFGESCHFAHGESQLRKSGVL